MSDRAVSLSVVVSSFRATSIAEHLTPSDGDLASLRSHDAKVLGGWGLPGLVARAGALPNCRRIARPRNILRGVQSQSVTATNRKSSSGRSAG